MWGSLGVSVDCCQQFGGVSVILQLNTNEERKECAGVGFFYGFPWLADPLPQIFNPGSSEFGVVTGMTPKD